jgi:ferredoxin
MPAPDRREFLLQTGKLLVMTAAAAAAWDYVIAGEPEKTPNYDAAAHWWAMIIDVDKCIGCGLCVQACKTENGVSLDPDCFRTWVERYEIDPDDPEHPHVSSPNGGYDGFPPVTKEGVKTFFVPKLCNQCADSPCVQVCPVGATFQTPDGVVLVDKEYCHRPADEYRRQVHAVLPPDHTGPADGLRGDLSDRRALPRRSEEPGGSHSRIPADAQGARAEAADGHASEDVLQRARRIRAMRSRR